MLQDSPLVASHRVSTHAVQDAYSLRCTPQVHGACRDLLTYAEGVVDRELQSVIDNPIVFPDDGDIISAGNFHGEGLAFAHDMLAIAMAELASISERRLNRMLDEKLSRGLPAFLTPRSGINSGLMLAQYTAAALVTELRLNAQPASIHSISTSAEQEDHVSMGWTAARQAMASLELVSRVVGVELLAACQALEFRAPLLPAPATAAVLARVRAVVPRLTDDRPPAPDMAAVAAMVRSGDVVRAAVGALGEAGLR
jgi:histidine ammonia-lyase